MIIPTHPVVHLSSCRVEKTLVGFLDIFLLRSHVGVLGELCICTEGHWWLGGCLDRMQSEFRRWVVLLSLLLSPPEEGQILFQILLQGEGPACSVGNAEEPNCLSSTSFF